MTRPRLLLAAILTAVVVLCVCLWVGEGPLWRLTMLHTDEWKGEDDKNVVRGWYQAKRWLRNPSNLFARWHGLMVLYYAENGYKFFEGVKKGELLTCTEWNIDGTVRAQVQNQIRWVESGTRTRRGGETKASPPWWWGVEDQTKPTAPWWNEKDK